MRIQRLLRTISVALKVLIATVASLSVQTTHPAAEPQTTDAVVVVATAIATRPEPGGSATDPAPTHSLSSDARLHVGPASSQERSTVASNDEQIGTALVLLEHIQSVLDEATIGKSGMINLDRGVVDQLRAEVAAVRGVLRKERSQP